jgi:hypothetical protein
MVLYVTRRYHKKLMAPDAAEYHERLARECQFLEDLKLPICPTSAEYATHHHYLPDGRVFKFTGLSRVSYGPKLSKELQY